MNGPIDVKRKGPHWPLFVYKWGSWRMLNTGKMELLEKTAKDKQSRQTRLLSGKLFQKNAFGGGGGDESTAKIKILIYFPIRIKLDPKSFFPTDVPQI
jgi:hypothetical protein